MTDGLLVDDAVETQLAVVDTSVVFVQSIALKALPLSQPDKINCSFWSVFFMLGGNIYIYCITLMWSSCNFRAVEERPVAVLGVAVTSIDDETERDATEEQLDIRCARSWTVGCCCRMQMRVTTRNHGSPPHNAELTSSSTVVNYPRTSRCFRERTHYTLHSHIRSYHVYFKNNITDLITTHHNPGKRSIKSNTMLIKNLNICIG